MTLISYLLLSRMSRSQHENAHNVKLEWIIIWLIVISVVLELWVIAWDIFGSSAEKHR